MKRIKDSFIYGVLVVLIAFFIFSLVMVTQVQAVEKDCKDLFEGERCTLGEFQCWEAAFETQYCQVRGCLPQMSQWQYCQVESN